MVEFRDCVEDSAQGITRFHLLTTHPGWREKMVLAYRSLIHYEARLYSLQKNHIRHATKSMLKEFCFFPSSLTNSVRYIPTASNTYYFYNKIEQHQHCKNGLCE